MLTTLKQSDIGIFSLEGMYYCNGKRQVCKGAFIIEKSAERSNGEKLVYRIEREQTSYSSRLN